MATYQFTNAYRVNTATTPAGKEANSHDFAFTSLGAVTINDNTGSASFSGNDVSAIGVVISDATYYGWISRPIKVGGQVKGFYFWTDTDFTDLGLAQTDGNQDGDSNVGDNLGFILVVDQSYFNGLGLTAGAIGNVGSSSDRVDSALNSLIPTNVAPVGVADTATALEAGGALNATAGTNPTGNVTANDTDANSGDTKTVTKVGTTTAGTSVAASSTSSSNATSVTGTYGTLVIGADGSYSYTVDNSNTTVEGLRTTSNTLTDTFTYTVADSKGLTSTTTLVVTIQGKNDNPTAFNDYNTAKESIAGSGNYTGTDTSGALATGNVLTNDTDKDSGDGKTISGGTSASVTATVVAGTTIILSTATTLASGKYLYVGTTALYDTTGAQLLSGTQPADHLSLPLSGTPDAASIALLNGSNQVFLYSNSGGNGLSGTIASSTYSAFGASNVISVSSVAGITVGATVSGVGSGLTVTAVDNATLHVTLSSTVSFSGSTSLTFGTTMSSGAKTFFGDQGTLSLNVDGTYTYTPTINNANISQGQTATETFTYTMQDTAGATSSANLVITVRGSGTTDPNAVSDTATAVEAGGTSNGTAGTDPSANLLTNDTTPSGTNSVVSARASGSSSDTTVGTDTAIAGLYGTLTVSSTGAYTYAANNSNATVQALADSSATLTDTFSYTIQNTAGVNDSATLTVTIQGANDAPVGVNDVALATEAGGLANATAGYNPTGNVLTNDSDVDSGATQTVSAVRTGSDEGLGTDGTVGSALTGTYGSLTLNANGTYAYTVDNSNATVNGLAAGATLTDSFNYTVSDGSLTDIATLTVTITGATDTLTVNDVYVNEASAFANFTVTGTDGMPVTLALANTVASGLALTDTVATLGTDLSNQIQYFVTGTGWTDYTSGSVTLPTGGVMYVRVAITSDTVHEGNESFTLTVTTTSSDVTSDYGVGTIGDEGSGDVFLSTNNTGTADGSGTNDDRPTISITSPTVTEGGTPQFTVSLSNTSTQTISFRPTVTSSTATVGTDTAASTAMEVSTNGGTNWSTVSGAVTIAAGQSSVLLRLATVDDALVEGTETFTVGTGYINGTVTNLTGVTGTATITDNDSAATLAVDSVTVNEAAGTATFTVTRSGSTTGAASVQWATSNGTASSGADYTDSSGTLNFADGDATKTFTVAIANDTVYEGSETFTVTLSNASGATIGTATGTGTIKDDGTGSGGTDNDTPTISVSSPTVTEGAPVVFTVSIDKTSSSAISFTPSLSSGTATLGSDTAAASTLEVSTNGGTTWSTVSGAVTIAAGQSSVQLRLATVDDALAEGAETFTLSTGAITGTVTNTGAATSTATITDNDTAPTLAIDDVTVNEAAGTASFTVTRSGATGATASVDFATSDGTATAGADYTSTTGTVNFAAGETSKTVTVTITNDSVYEGSEAFNVTLSNASGATISDATGIGTIRDDGAGSGGTDDDTPTISVDSPTITEGANAVFTVSLNRASTTAVSFTPTLANGSATIGTDTAAASTLEVSTNGGTTWSTVSGAVTIAAGQSSVQLRLATVDDALAEGAEAFTLATGAITGTVTNTTGATGTATITDNDSAPTLAIDDVTVNEAAGTATFTVTRSGATGATASADWATSDNTATAGADYTTASGTVNFAAGESSKTITVTIANDSVYEGSETFSVTLSNASGATISDDTGVGTIRDDGAGSGGTDNDTPTISVSSPTVAEGATVVFTVSIDKTSASAISFTPSLSSGTATLGTDTAAASTLEVSTDGGTNWSTVSGAVTIAAGQSSVQLRLATVDDAIAEGAEAFTLSTGAITGTVTNAGGASGSATITDNDTAPTLAIDDVTVNEAAGTATFTVTRSGATGATASADWATSDNTATAGADYTASNGSVSFGIGETTKTFTVAIADDAVYEGSETFSVTLSNASGATIGTATGSGTIIDNDTAGITLSQAALTTSEAGTTASFTVRLNTQPVNDVVVTLTGLDASEGSLSTSTLTFTSANWNTAQTVTVTGADDALVDGSIGYTLTATTSGDSGYDGANSKTGTVAVTNTDNDTAGITLSESALTTGEAGTTASFTVRLNTQPVNDVVVTLTGLDATEGSLSASTLTFTSANWNTAQTVTVTGADDSLVDGSIGYTLTATTSGDSAYDGANSKTGTVAVTNTDNDTAGITLSESALTTSEAGTTASFTVRLNTQPVNDVVVTLTGLDATEGSLSTSTLTFTSANWNTAQTVTVTGADDSLVDGSIGYTLTAATSGDAAYDGANSKTGTVAVTNTDNDTAGITLSESALTTSEAGTTASFTVRLNTQPVNDVVVTLTGLDATEGSLSATTLTFTAANWNTAQTVTVTGVDDALVDGSIGYTLTATTSGDAAYDGANSKTGTVAVTNTDNDTAGITLSQSALTTSEAGTTASFTVRLNTQPVNDVVVTLTGLDATEGSLSTSTLTFTSANWNTAQTITVTGADDALVDGSIGYTLTATTGGDAAYDGANSKTGTVAVTNTDNDTAGITLSESALTTGEAGTTASFTVRLNTQPVNDVVVTLTGLDATEGSLSTSTLTFTSANWNTAQTVTVTGADDALVDGSIGYTLTAATSGDAAYDGANSKTGTVDVTNTDNDTAGITLSESALTTGEAGTTASFTIRLNTQPVNDVVVTLTGLDATEGGLSSSTLTFTSANWSTAQTITVTGADDSLVDGSIGYTLTAATSGDAAYDGANSKTGTVAVTNTDNDTAGITLSQSALTTSEAGTTASFTVRLNTQPVNDVVVTLTGLDATEGSLSTSTLTFTSANWNTAQTITVTGADDALVDGSIGYTLTATTGGDAAYDGANSKTGTVAVTNTDNDTAGITLSESALTTGEAGTTASFTVRLNTQPVNDVVVTLTGLDATEGGLSTSTLTFTSANWNTAQTITVTGADDALVDGSIGYTLTAATSGDAAYDGANSKTGTVAVTNTDNDTAGITLSQSALTTSEAGTTATFTVRLNTQPVNDVVVTLTGLDATEGSLSSSTLTFTAANWNTAQTVTVTGADDALVDGSIGYTLTATTSGDSAYDGANSKTGTVAVTNTDNDTAGITLSQSALTTSEAGTTASFTVRLNTQPVNDVVVTLTGLDASEGSLSASTLTFTAANWNTAQTITVTGADDALVDGSIGYTLTAATSGDSAYDGANSKTGTVAVTNTDNDTAGITLSESALTTGEAGTTGSFTVRLNTQPVNDVVVTLTGLDATEGSLSTTTLTFTSANWNTAQTVTVIGADDALVDGSIGYTLTATTSGDSAYDGANSKTGTVAVTNTDNDTAGITLSESALTTSEAGTTASFTVRLNTQPVNDVVVTLTGLDATEGGLSTSTLTFTSANWNTAQTITVTGADDALVDGSIGYTLTASTSGDAAYDGANSKTGTVAVTNTDNDTAGITLSESALTTSEAGTTASFTVRLNTQPVNDVVVTLTGLDATEGSLSATTLTFTAANWNTAQTITVTGADDALVDGSIDYTLTAATSGDAAYDGANSKTGTVAVTNTDNDTAGITLSQSALTTSEAGTTATFTVRLNTQPVNDVVVTLTGLDATEGSLSSSTLTFTAANWNTAQTVTVTGADDALVDGSIGYTLTAATSGDSAYDGANSKTGTVAVTNTDNDTAGITLSESALTTSEAGTTASFTVRLNTQPVNDVVVTLTGLDATEGGLSTSTLTFTSANWNTAQTITVTGADDALVDGSIGYTLTAATSGDAAYDGANSKTGTVDVTNTDNDTAGITLSQSALTTSEAGTTATFTVRLNTQPVNDVVVTLTGLDATEGSLSSSTLTFTAANWNTAQTVTVTGADDSLVDGSIGYTLTATTSGDAAYDGANSKTGTVAVTNTDNDTAGITLSESALTTSEAGTSASFTVRLNTQPVNDVVVTLTGLDATEGSLSTTTLTFTSANWNTAQTVTVIGADDALVDGSIGYTLTAATSGDSAYDGANSKTGTVAVTNTDNDTAGITLSQSALTTSEAGTTASFTVRLNTQPVNDVVVTLTGLDATEGSLSASTLTFTAANWNTAQTVTVTGADDSLVDGSIGYTLTAATSGDAAYDGANSKTGTVAVTNTDNDTAGITLSQSALTTSEAGTTASFTIRLNTQPVNDVVVTLTGLDATEGSLSASTLTFTSANWNTAQTITVTGADDSLVDGSIGYTLTASTSGDAAYDGTNSKTGTVAVTNTDNDTAGITLSQSALTTGEAGTTATFTVRLNTQPVNDVVVTLTGLDATEGSLSSSTLTFTAANWNTAQTVTVTGADDALVDGSIGYTLTAATSGDAAYDGANSKTGTVDVTNTDNDTAGITLSESALTTSEAGTTASFTVRLNTQPVNDVVVTLTGLDATEGSLSASTLTFTSANWNTAQTVTVTGADDALVDGSIGYTLTASTSGDAAYDGANSKTGTVAVTNTDNDTAGITLSQSALTTGEAGTTASFTVRLNTQPVNDVVVTLTGLDASEGSLSASTLTFTAANWNTAQTITVTGADDALVDGSIGYTLTATTRGDAAYDGANSKTGNVDVTNTDNDTAGITLSQAALTTSEAGTTASFTIKLNTQPVNDVVVTLTGLDATEGSLSTSTLTFTAANWNTAQTVTVTGADDALVDGNIDYTLTATTSGDSAYDGANSKTGTVAVTNIDNDTAGITLSQAALTTSEAGITASFTIKLNTQPVNDVTVTLTGLDATEGSLSASTLTFTAANWNTAQTVTVTGADDALVDGDIAYTLTAATSGDSAYNGANSKTATVAVTNTDNDTAGLTLSATTLTTSEAGTSASFTINLNTQPVNDVVVTLTGLDATEGSLSTTTLTFTAANWNTPQAVTVTGLDDILVDGRISYTLTAITSGDATYHGANSKSATVAVANTDNDTALPPGPPGPGSGGQPANPPTNPPANPPTNPPTDNPPTNPPPDLSADLDPSSDNGPSNTDRVTSIITPEFTVVAAGLLAVGQFIVLVAPDGKIAGMSQVTAQDVVQGNANVPSGQLDDGIHTFTAYVVDGTGQSVLGSAVVTVTVITDRDGVQPSVELAANGGDFNGDGIFDWEQNNVAQLPLRSVSDFLAGKDAPAASFGAIMAGNIFAEDPGGAVQLDPTAQLLDLGLAELPAPLPDDVRQATPVLNFSVASQEGAVLQDLDPSRPGLQTRVIIDLPSGVNANSFIKWDAGSASWFEFLDDRDLSTFDDGATLLDTDGDGLIDRLVVTLTDGGVGDEDGLANGIVVDPGLLVLRDGANPVYSVLLAGGDRFYTTDAAEAAMMAEGTANVFEGVRFDSLDAAAGGRQLFSNYNPFTTDWYFAADGDPMPYICYERMPMAGFQAAQAGQGPGADFHLFINGSGITQLVTLAEAANLSLAAQGFADRGSIFNTTTSSAFVFDAEAYLVANRSNLEVQILVQSLAASYGSTRDAGFIEAVEQHYLKQIDLVGLTHGGNATATEVNGAFGTTFTG